MIDSHLQEKSRFELHARKALDGLFARLKSGCALWNEYREYYLGPFISNLKSGDANATEEEQRIIDQIRLIATPAEWEALPQLFADYEARDSAAEREAAKAKRQAAEESRRREVEAKARREREEKRERQEDKRLSDRLREQRAKQKKVEEEKAKRDEELRLERELARREIHPQLIEALQGSVEYADLLNKEINAQGFVDYAELKASYVGKWLSRNFSGQEVLSPEQINAVGEMSPSYLLRARAGSGKTKVITAKACFLMKHENIPPDNLMILAFNSAAAKQVSNRIKKDQKIIDYANARTFHSLAYQLVPEKPGLLYDEKTGSTKKQSQFVQDLINSVLNPVLLAQIYMFFRQEIKELEDIGAFMSKEDYYAYRRNHVQESLGGDHVKSIGEKWLADFLFEHGISYGYEKIWYWDDEPKRTYQPDFSLFTGGTRTDIVIEHWGIDLNDPRKQAPEHWDTSWQDYRDQIDRKRAFWDRHNLKNPTQPVKLLETSIVDLRSGREAFEERLTELLTDAGVVIRRLSEKDLFERVVRTRIGRFSGMCLQYIQKAKRQRLSPDDMSAKIQAEQGLELKTLSFLTIANNLYRRYQKELARQNLTDFDDLMVSAIEVIHQTEGNGRIRVDHDRSVSMNELRWILIDEYQDFSRLFYDLVDAIRTYNPSVNLFCVGDNWQAINAFAGSDLSFFDQFQKIVKGSGVGDLQNNYRSASEIVHLGNNFMQGHGAASIPMRSDLPGRVEICHTNEVWIEQRRADEHADERQLDERFHTWIGEGDERRQVDRGLRIGRMLKKAHEILTDGKYDRSKQFAILSRVERLGTGYRTLQAFHRKLRQTLLDHERRAFGDFDKRVHCGTVHSFKGREADVVIVLNVNSRTFPKIHPDNELYSVLGVTHQDVLAEERRLFYVALSRAQRDLYLFTESGLESEYLSSLSIPPNGTMITERPNIVSSDCDFDDIRF